MNTTRHADDVMIVLILPRAARETAARLTSRLASKRNGMSVHAEKAVEALLTPNDRVELTYLQAVAVSSQCYAESARIESARSRNKLTARHLQVEQVIGWVTEQTSPQMIATPVDLDGIWARAEAPALGQIRMGTLGRHRAPEKLNIFPRES